MNFDELLRQLQAEYLASIPEKVTEIQLLIANGDTTKLREAFHKLKGTGKTYGMPEVSELCAVIEMICIKMPHAALQASETGAEMLQEIHQARSQKNNFALHEDARLHALRKLLPAST